VPVPNERGLSPTSAPTTAVQPATKKGNVNKTTIVSNLQNPKIQVHYGGEKKR